MATKFYLHDAASSVVGTLPGASSLEVSAGRSAPTVTATGASTNRSMDLSLGVLQTSAVLTTNAVTTSQSGWLRRFISQPLAAQTISLAADSAFGFSIVESSTNSSLTVEYLVYVWRPGAGGSYVGTLSTGQSSLSGQTIGQTGSSATTTAAWANSGANNGPTTSLAVSAGDVLVVELWRTPGAQLMATSYTNTVFYDGTTEGSATNAASYIQFAQTLTFQGGGATVTPPRPTIISQAINRGASWMQADNRCWQRRSGILVPRLWTPTTASAV